MTIQPRDDRPTISVLSTDLQTLLDNHPRAFDCLLYKAVRESAEDAMVGTLEDIVGSMEGSARKIDYADPITTRAFVLPEDGFSIDAYTDGTGGDIVSTDSPMVILLKEQGVPKESVIVWKEYTGQDDEVKEITMYIQSSKPFGKAAGIKHYCIPMTNEGEMTDGV